MANLYGLRDCSNQLPTIYTNTLLTPGIASYLNLVIYIDGYPDTCWVVVNDSSLATTVPVTILANYEKCEECIAAIPTEPPVFRLADCTDNDNFIYTTEALTPGITAMLGGVVFLSEYLDKCWKVGVVPSGSTQAYTIINTFNKCNECIAALPPVPSYVYRLINCLDPLQVIYSFTIELGGAVGQVVNLTQYEGICWSVSTVVYNDQTTEDVTILRNDNDVPQIFEDCDCCLPAPEPEPVKYTRIIPKPDRAFYQITQSQCDIQANIRFADNYYRLFKMLKYGMNSMCDNVDLDRVWIKKMQSDLAVINDPTACIITTPVTPVICPEPS
jgi:hypothetical protein